jgi:hypothetical protein
LKGLSFLVIIGIPVVNGQDALKLVTEDLFRYHIFNPQLCKPGPQGPPEIMGREMIRDPHLGPMPADRIGHAESIHLVGLRWIEIRPPKSPISFFIFGKEF